MWAPRQAGELKSPNQGSGGGCKGQKVPRSLLPASGLGAGSEEELERAKDSTTLWELAEWQPQIPPGPRSREAEPPRTRGLHQRDTFLGAPFPAPVLRYSDDMCTNLAGALLRASLGSPRSSLGLSTPAASFKGSSSLQDTRTDLCVQKRHLCPEPLLVSQDRH